MLAALGGRDDAGPRREELAERLDLNLDRPVGDLSKGNRQKVAVIYAFQHRPQVLVLDEPTAGLDPLDAPDRAGPHSRGGRRRGGRPSVVARSERGIGRVQPAPRSCARAGWWKRRPLPRSSQQGEHRLKVWFVDGTLMPEVPMDRLPGVRIVERQAGHAPSRLPGHGGRLLKWVAQFPVDRIATPQTSLEEAFIQYYRQPPHAGGRGRRQEAVS